MRRAGMATSGTCSSALERCFQSWSIGHGSSSSKGICSRPMAKDESAHKCATKWPLEISSQPALPYQWEQFLDLKTGELYYVDWSVCKKAKNDPREVLRVAEDRLKVRFEELTSLLSDFGEEKLPTTPEGVHLTPPTPMYYSEVEDDTSESESMDEDSDDPEQTRSAFVGHEQAHQTFESEGQRSEEKNVLVAAGCQRCLMYFMLPKPVVECPTCGTVLLHFNEPAAHVPNKGKEAEE